MKVVAPANRTVSACRYSPAPCCAALLPSKSASPSTVRLAPGLLNCTPPPNPARAVLLTTVNCPATVTGPWAARPPACPLPVLLTNSRSPPK
jgi:hypothetical protein